MKTKTIIFLLIGAVVLYFGYKYYQQMQNRPESSTDEVSDSRIPTISELLGKNYSEEEARQIIEAVKDGKISSY